MQKETENLLREIGFAVIRYREVYRRWCRRCGIKYHEMLIFYTLRDMGTCTQKEISDSYALPKQTVHNIVHDLKARGLLLLKPDGRNHRERRLQLTEAGKRYAANFMEPLLEQERAAVAATGPANLREAIRLLRSYTAELDAALNPTEKTR